LGSGKLFSVIDAAKLARDYASSNGLKLQFTSEDIRVMGATLYIDQWEAGKQQSKEAAMVQTRTASQKDTNYVSRYTKYSRL